jgi:hypothetical protein
MMKNLKFVFSILIFLALGNGFLQGQDMIYKTDGSFIEGEVVSIDKENVKFKIKSGFSNIDQSIRTLQVALIFFENGQYSAFPFEGPNALNSKSFPKFKTDLLLTKYAEILEGEIISLQNDQARLKLKGTSSFVSVNFNDLVVGIYANGKHAMFRNPAESISILNHVQSNVRNIGTEKPQTASKSPIPSNRPDYIKISQSSQTAPMAVTQPGSPKAPEVNDAFKAETSNVPITLVNEQKEVESTKPVAGSLQEPESPKFGHAYNTSESVLSENTDDLTDLDFAEFSDKAMQKIDDLGSFISLISSKETYPDQANQAIDLAVNLFVSEEAVVEVSTVGYSALVKRKIREYLNRLKLLKYDKVDIRWADLNYVSNFRKGPDGNYYGTVSLKQTFQGYVDNQVVYSDVTQKEIEVVLKSMEKAIEGKEQMVWDVLLSDMGVVDTRNQ